MQVTIKSARVAKTGTSKRGDWELIAVTSAKGTEYTTFDKKVKHLGEGSIIEIGEPEEKDGKFSFKEAEIIKEVPVASPEPTESKPYKRDTEGIDFEYQWKAKLQERERQSIESQTAYRGIIELVKESNAWKSDGFEALVTKAFKWAEARLDGTAVKLEPSPERTRSTRSPVKPETSDVTPEEAVEPAPQKPKRDPSTLKTITDMYKACHADFRLQPKDVMAELNITSWNELTETPADCYRRIQASRQ